MSHFDLKEDKMVPIWQSRPTCWVSKHKQGTVEWRDERIGRIPASLMAEICGRKPVRTGMTQRTPEELAEIVCGLRETVPLLGSQQAMQIGIQGEPYVRNWYSSKIIHRPITEVGLAVWKKDPCYGASLDGETIDDEGQQASIEIKIPEKLNKVYVDIFQSWKSGFHNRHPQECLFASHYDQMTTGSIITDKKGCYYIVACLNEGECFHWHIETDNDLWNNVLYPKSKEFHDTYVKPLLLQHNIKVIDPLAEQDCFKRGTLKKVITAKEIDIKSAEVSI